MTQEKKAAETAVTPDAATTPSPSPSPRHSLRRTSAIDAGALLRARAREKQREERVLSPEERAAQEAETQAFESAFPVEINAQSNGDVERGTKAKRSKTRTNATSTTNRTKRGVTAKGKVTKAPLRTPTTLMHRLCGLVRTSLEGAANELLGRSNPEFALVPLNPVRVIVAISGGRDSMAMLDAVARLFRARRQTLIADLCAVYVHHGYEADADNWDTLCRETCERLRVKYACLRVRVREKGEGLEAAAREARYRALADYAVTNGWDVVLTGHHEDDRIETFLLQWMRGAGLEGLAAFPEARELTPPTAEGATGVRAARQAFLLRPWVAVPRSDIDRYVRTRKLKYADDPDNNDPRFTRNRVRHEVLPLLEAIRPGFRGAAARSVALVAEAVEVLGSVAAADLEHCRSHEHAEALSIFRLLELVPARQAWCLRAWLAEEGIRAIPKARLEDMLRQVRETHSDATFAIRLQGKEVRRWGTDLVIREAVKKRTATDAVQVKASTDGIALPEWGGMIEFLPCEKDEPGIARAKLLSPETLLEVRSSAGGSKLRLWALRPSRPLKDLYAQAGIPAYARAELPRLWMDGALLFAAGLGTDVRFMETPEVESDQASDRVRLRWHPDHSLWEDRSVPNYADLPEEERRAREMRLREAAREMGKTRKTRETRETPRKNATSAIAVSTKASAKATEGVVAQAVTQSVNAELKTSTKAKASGTKAPKATSRTKATKTQPPLEDAKKAPRSANPKKVTAAAKKPKAAKEAIETKVSVKRVKPVTA